MKKKTGKKVYTLKILSRLGKCHRAAPMICSKCAGTGEGMHEGTICHKCHGSGTLPIKECSNGDY